MPAAELNHKKRAIHIALLTYLNPKQATDAIEIWLNEFSHNSVFELQSFITRITKEFNVSFSRKEIQQTIIKMLLNETHDVEQENVEVKDLSSAKEATELKPSHIIFSLLISQWLNEINTQNPSHALKIKRYIANNLIKMDLSFDEMMNIKRWLSSSNKNIYIKDLDIKQMKSLFHICYIGSCEYIGPVRTDTIVSEVTGILEQSPEAVYFSPRDFF